MSESQSVSRSRLELARDEVDRVFGSGYAAAHSDVVSAVMISASVDFHALMVLTHGLSFWKLCDHQLVVNYLKLQIFGPRRLNLVAPSTPTICMD
jgi:hypothetical protein